MRVLPFSFCQTALCQVAILQIINTPIFGSTTDEISEERIPRPARRFGTRSGHAGSGLLVYKVYSPPQVEYTTNRARTKTPKQIQETWPLIS